MNYTYIGGYDETNCLYACIERRKSDKSINGVGVHANSAIEGCWCLRDMPSRNEQTAYKSCVLEGGSKILFICDIHSYVYQDTTPRLREILSENVNNFFRNSS